MNQHSPPRATANPTFVGIGANLAHPRFGSPRNICIAAVTAMEARGLKIVRQSRWYESAPVPVSDQPRYVNGVVMVKFENIETDPEALLRILHGVEREFGRTRGAVNEARVLDLDLLACGNQVVGWWLDRSKPAPKGAGAAFSLPHPRLHERAFVLLPLRDIAPGWVHPATGQSIDQMVSNLAVGQDIRIIDSTG